MKIKTQISLGMLLLFSMFVLIGGLGTYNLNKISNNMEGILHANFESLEYARNMLKILDDLRRADDEHQTNPLTLEPLFLDFDNNLAKQEGNVTEIGEEERTGQVRVQFEILKRSFQHEDTRAVNNLIASLNQNLYEISALNSKPIIRKNEEAAQTAHRAITLMTAVATFCLLLAFSFIFNFPGFIARPIKDLTEGIKNIADRNYDQRLHFKSGNEFGELAEAFNRMAQRLEEYEHSSLANIISEKQRIEAIIDHMRDPVIGLDENRHILFVNTAGLAVLGMKKEALIGRYAPDVALKNDLLRALLNGGEEKAPLKIYAEGKESYFGKEVLDVKSGEKSLGNLLLLRNITQFQEREQAKTTLLAAVAHEIKAPAQAMLRNLDLLKEQIPSNAGADCGTLLTQIREDLERVIRMTATLLGAS